MKAKEGSWFKVLLTKEFISCRQKKYEYTTKSIIQYALAAPSQSGPTAEESLSLERESGSIETTSSHWPVDVFDLQQRKDGAQIVTGLVRLALALLSRVVSQP